VLAAGVARRPLLHLLIDTQVKSVFKHNELSGQCSSSVAGA